MRFDGEAITNFIKDNVRLRPLDPPVKLFPYQEEVLATQNRFRLIVKSRQVGISAVMAWETLATAILYNEITILFVSASERQASELLTYVKNAFFNMKVPIRLKEETKTSLVFSNNSRIISLPNSPNTVMGFRAQRVYLDEFAFYERDKKMLEAILPSISHGGTVTVFSRPGGKGNEFYRLYEEAQKGLNNFVIFEIPWWECPDPIFLDMIENQIKPTLDDISFRESYCCEFVDEKFSFLPYEIILPNINENLMQKPEPIMELSFGIDFGKKINSTAVIVVEHREGKKYVRKIQEFLGTTYTEQLNWISETIKELKPRSVYIDAFGVGIRLHEELREKHGSVIVPIELTEKMKEMLIQNVRIMLEDRTIEIPRDEKLITQLHALERHSTGAHRSYRHKPGEHDDYVWALAMAVYNYTPPPIRYFASSNLAGPIAKTPLVSVITFPGEHGDEDLL